MTDQLIEYRSQLGIETKTFEKRTSSEIETRGKDDDEKSFTFRGLASRTEVEYDVYDYYGKYTEKILTGAFERTLSENPTVLFLIMHDGLPLASFRNGEGTMKVWESERGLEVEADLSMDDYRAAMIRNGVERGDILEMSFAFRVEEQSWDDNYTYRTISRVNIHRGDVSVVNYGANPESEIDSVRSERDENMDKVHEDTTSRALLLQQQLEEELFISL